LSKPNKCFEEVDTEWVDGYVSKECPVLAAQEYNFLFTMYSEYSKYGNYPIGGGLMNQSPKLLEVFKTISNEIDKIKSEQDS